MAAPPSTVPHARRRAAAAVVGVVLLAAVAACSDDEDPGDEADRYREKVAADLVASQEENSVTFTDDEADCVAGRVTAGITAERLEELGIEDTQLEQLELSDAERATLFEAFASCLDLEQQVVDLFTSDGTLTEEVARCVAERYTATAEFRDSITTSEPDEALNARIDAVINDAADACQG